MNTEYQLNTGVIADPFGDNGTRIVGFHNEKPLAPFILDRDASLALAARLIKNAVGDNSVLIAGALDVGCDGIEDFETRQIVNALARHLAGVTA